MPLDTPRSRQPPPGQKQLLKRFWHSAAGFWRGPSSWRVWLLVALMIAVMLLQLLTLYGLNFWNRYFFDAIERKDGEQLWRQALLFLPLGGSSLLLAIVSVWARMTTQRRWRAWLSNHLYDYWLEHDRHRRLRFMNGDHQGPEYRIAEDARVATDLPIDLVLGLFSSCLTAITFIGVLWEVGGALPLGAGGMTLPGYLVIAVVIYSVVLTAAMMIIGRHLTRVITESKRAEAHLRSVGAHLRQTGEAPLIADVSGGERRSIRAALDEVIRWWRAYCWQLMRMTLVTHTNGLLTPVVGLLLCMPKYLADTMSLGQAVQAAAAFVMVQGAFNWITDSYGRLAEWTASANRVASLLLALDEVERPGRATG
ncbi:MAG: hypothetical protein OJI70_12785, partial [Zavarzinia sp.]|nr:hypothetical protein [Zavarzinia sp.]